VATLRDIRTRIAGVEKTQKIVSAMKMVAAAKLARAQAAIHRARPYAETLRKVLASVSAGVEADAHPLLMRREPVRKLDVVVLTSNRGLCGAFNANMVKEATALIAEREADTESISLIPIGRKGAERFAKRRLPMPREWIGSSGVTPELGTEIADALMERFLEGEADETILVYGEFRSALSQAPTRHLLLPVRPGELERDVDSSPYEIEPGPEELLGQLIPRAVEFAVFRSLLENDASEHGARMTAMDSATSNTEELIRTLTLDYNKERQAAITAELVEIVGGAEAL
jgi:F-type H+-transporting ATPase subunit gamma